MEMKEYEYSVMANVENNYWWYKGLHDLVLRSINATPLHNCHSASDGQPDTRPAGEEKANLRILDAGCGTGRMLELLNGYDTYGVDLSRRAIELANQRGLQNIEVCSVTKLPYEDSFFDYVLSLDVLSCLPTMSEENCALREAWRILKPGGRIILNLPAFSFLKGEHDIAVSTTNRYTKKSVTKYLRLNDFTIEKMTYCNMPFFPLLAISRAISAARYTPDKPPHSDLKPLPRFLNNLFCKIRYFENSLINRNITFPVGTSVFCIARKP